ncbi:MAG TPA: hypothetical protein DCW93_05095 [Saprospirales bacterium]|jgi:hypothetical protein|nr:hypothetical protein [Saprospirales bacterium]
MRDILKDIVKHTHSLGIIQAVKVTTDDTSTVLDAMDDDRTVVLRAKMHKRVDEFNGKFGMGRLGVLNGYLSYENQNENGDRIGADITVGTTERNGEVVPSELAFSMKGVFDSTYRVIVSEMVDAQIKTANFKGAKWDVEVMPSSKAVKDLQTFAGILGSYDPLFTVKTEGNDLMFHIGDASTDKLSLKFASNVDGTLSTGWSFPLSTVLTILKLGDTSSMSIKISDQGAMAIHVDSGMGLYEYILPAKSGN